MLSLRKRLDAESICSVCMGTQVPIAERAHILGVAEHAGNPNFGRQRKTDSLAGQTAQPKSKLLVQRDCVFMVKEKARR